MSFPNSAPSHVRTRLPTCYIPTSPFSTRTAVPPFVAKTAMKRTLYPKRQLQARSNSSDDNDYSEANTKASLKEEESLFLKLLLYDIPLPTTERSLTVPLGYFLALGGIYITSLLPVVTTALLGCFFLLYVYMSQAILSDSTEKQKSETSRGSDLAAFLAAIPSAILLSPNGGISGSGNDSNFVSAEVLVGIAAMLTTAVVIFQNADLFQDDSEKEKQEEGFPVLENNADGAKTVNKRFNNFEDVEENEDEEGWARNSLRLWDEKFQRQSSSNTSDGRGDSKQPN